MSDTASTAKNVKAQAPKRSVKGKKVQQDDIMGKVKAEVSEFFNVVENGQVVEPLYDSTELTCICGVTIAILLSAFWAASIAGARRHNAFVSFIGGLVIPWIYPLVILFTMTIPDKWDLKKKKREEEAAAVAKVIEEAEANDIKADDDGVIPYSATPQYFEKIARLPDGQPAGPWKAVFNGNVVFILKIIEVLPEALNVEFKGHKGDAMKMRIPYSKIESWEDAQPEEIQ